MAIKCSVMKRKMTGERLYVIDKKLKFFRYSISHSIERCNRIACRKQIADNPFTPDKAFHCWWGDRYKFVLCSIICRPEMEIIGFFLVGTDVQIEIFCPYGHFRRFLVLSWGCIEAFVMRGINRDLTAAFVNDCFHQLNSCGNRDQFPRWSRIIKVCNLIVEMRVFWEAQNTLYSLYDNCILILFYFCMKEYDNF